MKQKFPSVSIPNKMPSVMDGNKIILQGIRFYSISIRKVFSF